MPVAQATSSALQEHYLLFVACHLADIFTRLGIIDHRTHRHLDDGILAVLSERLVGHTCLAISGEDVTLVTQVEQGPVVAVAMQDDRASLASIAAIGSPLGDVLGAMQVRAATAALARATIDANVIDKIGFCHF